MRALSYDTYGDPEVLHIADLPEPHAGPGQVRIRTQAASVNPFDWKVRAGYLAEVMPQTFPAIPGVDASGVVDEVGDGVDGVLVGDEVFGIGTATTAEHCVLFSFAHKPAVWSWETAAAAGLVTETAARAMDLVGVGKGTTLLIEGASGGVGAAAVQLALHRGATVIGTSSASNVDYVASLGALATTYGPGLGERLVGLGHPRVDAVLDAAGSGSLPDLIALVDTPENVVSVADFSARAHGAQLADSSGARAGYVFRDVAALAEADEFAMLIHSVFSLDDAAAAHSLSQTGHVRGKIVLRVADDA